MQYTNPILVQNSNKNTDFKNRTIGIWNELAPRYHKRWVKNKKGPFAIIDKVISEAGIKKGDKVLDVACGTGAITRKAASKAGNNGVVIGVDSSHSALDIAKEHAGVSYAKNAAKLGKTRLSASPSRYIRQKTSNTQFVLADVEQFFVNEKFDKITCNFGIMFFPNSTKALRNLKRMLKKDGKIIVTVHGKLDTVPYFGCFIKSVLKFIPDYLPQKGPQIDRFGTKSGLRQEFQRAGFRDIRVSDCSFTHSVRSPAAYWNDYISYLPSPLRKKIDVLTNSEYESLKKMTIRRAKKFQNKGNGDCGSRLDFPWKVLIVTAKP